MATVNLTNVSCDANATSTDAPADGGALNLIISIVMTIAGAALLALTMVIQRFGLAYPKPRHADAVDFGTRCDWHALEPVAPIS